MKKLLAIFVVALLLVQCKKEEKSAEEVTSFNPEEYASFGEAFEIKDGEIYSMEEISSKYQDLTDKDTLQVIFKSSINEICQTKGCWMTLGLENEKESFVKFTDYAFFVPMNAQEKEAIVKGKAYKKVVPVEELKHYAEDEGKSPEEIAAITEPKVTLAFMADGVYIKKGQDAKQ